KAIQNPFVRILSCIAPDGYEQAVSGFPHCELRGPIKKMIFRAQIRAVLHLLQIRRRPAECVYACVKKIRVAGVNATFDSLQVVRLLKTFRNVPVRLWDTGPVQLRQFKHAIRWPQVSPDNSAILASQVGCRPHFTFECIPRWFVRHIHAGAVCVEFPSMIDASKTTVLFTPPEKAGSAVRTKLVK